VDYLVAKEWAASADDILWRRTKAGLHVSATARTELEAYLTTKSPTSPLPLHKTGAKS